MLGNVQAACRLVQDWFALDLPVSYKPLSDPSTSLDDRPAVANVLPRLRALIGTLLDRQVRKLPPERVLSQQFGVGRRVIRTALAILEKDGAVVRHVGRGTFIASCAGWSPPQLQALALAGGLAVGGIEGLSPRDLLEVRYVLEPAIAELAALSARPSDIVRLQECMRRREASHNIDDYEHWDFELHMAIATATHNKLLLEMLDLVNRMRRSAVWRKFRGPSIDSTRRRVSNAQHQAIVQAICQAEPEVAFATMRAHIGHVSAAYRGIFAQPTPA